MTAENHLTNPRIEFFNRAAAQWDESLTPEEVFFLRCMIDKATTTPDLGKRVLDVGCGTGILFPFLERWEVTALDISEEMLCRAQKKGARHVTEYVQGDAQALPFPDETFAMVFMLAVFPHFNSPLLAMKEICRVLKPGGNAIIFHLSDAKIVNSIHASIGGAIAHDFLPDEIEFRSLIQHAGFELCYSEFDGRVAMMCRKP